LLEYLDDFFIIITFHLFSTIDPDLVTVKLIV